jgi:beta-lactam-binding protein with PASTA domain
MVLQQVPPPGTQVQQKNQPVTLHVGKALAQTRVPTVTGMPLDAAQKQLAAAKLTAVVSFEAVTEQAKNNFVLKQQVAPGTALAPGSQVPLTVGKYTAPAALSVPSVTGKPLAEAQKILAANKLNAVVNQEKVTDKSKDGIVLKQHVAPGTALAPGSQVPLIAGRYEAPAKVPNVVGMDWSQAKAHLTQAKLTANIASRSTSLKQKHNIVLEQSVRAGTEVAPGTKADLVAGWYLTPAEMAREIEDRRHQPIPPDGQK